MSERVYSDPDLARRGRVYKHRDITGNVFGRWTVIRLLGREPRKHGARLVWLCLCQCGTEKRVDGSRLLNGMSQSCGCRTREKQKESARIAYGEASRNAVYIRYKANAKSRHFGWELSKDVFFSLISQNCHYCGCAPKTVEKARGNNGDYRYNGLDRVDNERGYTPDNIVPCCSECNYAKKDLPVDVFRAWIARLVAHQNSQKSIGAPA